jgi:hypothetical protein
MKAFKCSMCSLATFCWLATVANGQLATGVGQLTPQNAQTAQDAADFPGQAERAGTLDPTQGVGQDAHDSLDADVQDRSITPDGAREQAESGMARDSRPGELGVYLIEGSGRGVVIDSVVRTSAAQEAGLQRGDVILQIEGQGVEAPQEVTRIIRATPAGRTIALRIWRDGQEQDVDATLMQAGERRRVNFRGSEMAEMSGNLESRTRQLESQLATVLRELEQLRQEVMQLRASRPGATGGLEDISSPQDATAPATPPQGSTQPGLDVTPGQQLPTDTDTDLPF